MKNSVSRRKLLQSGMSCGAVMSAPAWLSGCASQTSHSASHTGISSSELLDYDALGLAQLIRRREITAQELLNVTMARIEVLEPKVNALTNNTFDRAQRALSNVSSESVFAGVPTLIKDLANVEGVARTDGSRLLLNNISKVSSSYIKALEASGLIIAGMSNTPELASLAITDNHAFGATHNPWDLNRTAGGSSGGSAAAVAAGYVPIAHGTDGGGSNRMPASCCGLFGMKPSKYRMLSGEADGTHGYFRTHQSISRTVRDSAALFTATQDQSRSAHYQPTGLITAPGERRLRIGVTANNFFGRSPSATVMAAFEDAVKLCESLGHEVVEVPNPVNGEQFYRAYRAMFMAKMSALLTLVERQSGVSAEASGLLTPMTVSMGRAAQNYTENDRLEGLQYFAKMTVDMQAFHQSVDVWLTPVLPVEPPLLERFSPDDDFLETLQDCQQYMSYTPIANGWGAPAMSVPLYWSAESGLPIGSHFSAKPGADAMLYELAFELEQARPWKDQWAPYSAKFAV